MSIQIRNIHNDDIMDRADQLDGPHIQTGSTDHHGRLVSATPSPLKAWRTALSA